MRPFKAARGKVPCELHYIIKQIEREQNYDYSSRFSESYRCGSRSRCPDCLRWFFFHCFFRCCIRQRGILCCS